jgi:hypothetical protein
MKIYVLAMALTAVLADTPSFLSSSERPQLVADATTQSGKFIDASVNQLHPMNRALDVTIGGTSM